MTDDIWKLSPSDFAFLWEECPCCFYLKVREGFRRPWTPFPKIFNQIDEAMKVASASRRLDELAPGAPEATVIYGERWVESEPITPPGASSQCFVRGKFDTLARFDDGTYALVDFKTSSRRSEHIPLYSRQLHAYVYALENAAPGNFSVSEVSRFGLLVYEPELFNSGKPGMASLDGRLTWIEMERDDESFLKFLADVTNLLESDEAPPSGSDCGFCAYREETRSRTFLTPWSEHPSTHPITSKDFSKEHSVSDSTEKILQMIRRQLGRKNPPGTEALYGRALRIDDSVRELSLRQFNAKYVLRVRREQKRSKTSRAKKSTPSSSNITNEARAQIRAVLLQLARDVLNADRADIIDVVADVDGYVDRVLAAVRE